MVTKHYFNNWWLDDIRYQSKKIIEKYPVKVLPFPGASADDTHYDLRPLLQKWSVTIILHVGTNNCLNEPSRVVLDKIFNLKTFTQNSLPQCKVIISTVINRTDDDKASLTVENLSNHLNSLKLKIVDKFNGLKLLVKNSLVVFMRSKTKLDETLPEGQFLMDGFNPPYRMDRNTMEVL